MFRIVIQNVPSAKIHATVGLLVAHHLAQNVKFRQQCGCTEGDPAIDDMNVVEGDWMNLADISGWGFNKMEGLRDLNGYDRAVWLIGALQISLGDGFQVLLETKGGLHRA